MGFLPNDTKNKLPTPALKYIQPNQKKLKCRLFCKSALTVVQQVGDVQAEGRQDGVEHFEVFAKPRHEQ